MHMWLLPSIAIKHCLFHRTTHRAEQHENIQEKHVLPNRCESQVNIWIDLISHCWFLFGWSKVPFVVCRFRPVLSIFCPDVIKDLKESPALKLFLTLKNLIKFNILTCIYLKWYIVNKIKPLQWIQKKEGTINETMQMSFMPYWRLLNTNSPVKEFLILEWGNL